MVAQRQEGAAGPQALQQEAALAVSKLLPPQSARILRGKAKPAKATQGAKKRTADAVADAAQGAKKRTATAVTRKEMSATSLLTSLPPADAGQLPPTGAHPSTLLHALQALQSYQHTPESEDEAIAASDEEDKRNTAPGAILDKMSEMFTKMSNAQLSLSQRVEENFSRIAMESQRSGDSAASSVRLRSSRNQGEYNRLTAFVFVLRAQVPADVLMAFTKAMRHLLVDYDASYDLDSALRKLRGNIKKLKWPQQFDIEALLDLLKEAERPERRRESPKRTSRQSSYYRRREFAYGQSEGAHAQRDTPTAGAPGQQGLAEQVAKLLASQQSGQQGAAPRPTCAYCAKTGHAADNCWAKYPDKALQRAARP